MIQILMSLCGILVFAGMMLKVNDTILYVGKNICACLAKHNQHQDNINKNLTTLNNTLTGVANFYKRSEDDKNLP